ncbi:hypothetical protein [Terriglobus roseus]|uniref:hypothetical protein n=1 Tax=Terriglobus roseus TaxID=392734 RepID=UPI00147A8A05|nr:hypothetical protein [Terriglobus roseus]
MAAKPATMRTAIPIIKLSFHLRRKKPAFNGVGNRVIAEALLTGGSGSAVAVLLRTLTGSSEVIGSRFILSIRSGCEINRSPFTNGAFARAVSMVIRRRCRSFTSSSRRFAPEKVAGRGRPRYIQNTGATIDGVLPSKSMINICPQSHGF